VVLPRFELRKCRLEGDQFIQLAYKTNLECLGGFEPTFDTISVPITDNGLEDRFDYKHICEFIYLD
jgi:hypothetical protein